MKLTATTIKVLELPTAILDKTFFDDDLPAFGLRLRAGGSRTWVVQYKVAGKNRRLQLGSMTALDPSKARSTAKDILAKIRLGGDPAGEKTKQRQKAGETFGAFLPPFLANARVRLKSSSYEAVNRFLTDYTKPWHGRPLDSLDRRSVASHLVEITDKHGPGAANRFRSAISTYFTWLIEQGIAENNPVVGTGKAPEGGARERVLNDDELVAIWCSAGDDQYGAIVRLLMATGSRRDEIAGLLWSEIDLDNATITLPGTRTKNRRQHLIPLSPTALGILQAEPRRFDANGRQRDLVFGYGNRGYQGWSKSKRELETRIELAGFEPLGNWWLHDFRRSMSTAMHERLGIMPHIVEATLGHLSGHRAGVAGVYNVADYFELRRVALKKWADHIETLITRKRQTAVVKNFDITNEQRPTEALATRRPALASRQEYSRGEDEGP